MIVTIDFTYFSSTHDLLLSEKFLKEIFLHNYEE